MNNNNEGSYWGGWWLGFLLGLIGLIISLAIDKPETKKGALHGFITSIVICVVAGVCIYCAGLGYLGGNRIY